MSSAETQGRPVPASEGDLLVEGLVRRYGHLHALDGVSFVAPAGQATVILGPNGAGKTTLLKVLAGLERADRGSARQAGKDLTSQDHELRARIGLVAHQPLVYPSLTAQENLRFSAGLRADPSRPVDEALAAVGLRRHRHRRAGTFSRGMQQRLTIARAILHEPDLLLLDEPFTGLDPDAADRLGGLLRTLVSQGRTLLISTHDLDRAEALSDRVIILDRGRVVWQGASDGAQGFGARSGHAEPMAAEGDSPMLDLRARYRSAMQAEENAALRRAEDGRSTVGRPASTSALPEATTLDRRQAPPAPTPAPLSSGMPSSAPRTRPAFLPAVRSIVWKDLVVELRSREIVVPVLVFGLVTTVVFQFALPRPAPGEMVAGAGGALWIALLFGSTLGLSRAMSA